jgi:two-component system, chemotaxis family, CheB/CheR fusion protein
MTLSEQSEHSLSRPTADDLKRTEEAALAARDYAEAIIYSVRDPLIILEADHRVHTANKAFYETFKVSPAETEGRLIYELGNGQWQIPKLRQQLEEILSTSTSFDNFEVTHNFEKIGPRTMMLNARMLRSVSTDPARILLGIEDVTESLSFQTGRKTRRNSGCCSNVAHFPNGWSIWRLFGS